MFDSPNLEAQQLTQYVGILRMMECPREQVIEKFLAAHKYRSLRMVKTFLKETDEAIATRKKETLASPGAGAGVVESKEEAVNPSSVLCVAFVRTFHQSLMVGLIESSKGVREMFFDTDAGHSAPDGTSDESDGAVSLATAYDELQATISIVMPEYLRCISKVLSEFFQRYDSEYGLEQSGKVEESKYTRTVDGTGQVVIQELEDERAVWIALMRQIILDCQYLDSGTESCRPPECDPSLPHADGVAETVLGILDSHFDKVFDKRIASLKVQGLSSHIMFWWY